MMSVINVLDKHSFGTFKFQYSKYRPLKKDRKFVPNDKELSEQMIAFFFANFLRRYSKSVIGKQYRNEDDSNKKADIYLEVDGIAQGLQITRLTFTRYEKRRAIAKDKALQFSKELSNYLHLAFPININIYPATPKTEIPFSDVKANTRNKLEATLIKFIREKTSQRIQEFKDSDEPIHILIDDQQLKPHFSFIVLNKIPTNAFSIFHGTGNIHVNFDIDDVSFSANDLDAEIADLFRKKNQGFADALIIWADKFELAHNTHLVVQRLNNTFSNTTFHDVFFICFENNPVLFRDSLELWRIK